MCNKNILTVTPDFMEQIHFVPFELIKIQDLFIRDRNDSVDVFQWHKIDFYALIIITNETCIHHIDCQSYHLTKGDIIPISPGQVHRFDSLKPINGYVLSFTELFLMNNISEKNNVLFLHLFNIQQIIKTNNLDNFLPLIKLIEEEQSHNRKKYKYEVLQQLLITIFIYIERYSDSETNIDSKANFVDFIRFKKLVSKKYNEYHNVSEYAIELNLSYKYINEISKEFTNKTAKVFIDSWIITAIKRLIAQNLYSMKEISYKMGFQESTNFVRFFKKHVGMTPTDFYEELEIKKIG